MTKKLVAAMVTAGAVLFLPHVHADESPDVQSRMIEIAGKAGEIRSSNPDGTRGKVDGLIRDLTGLDLGEKPGDKHRVMKLTLMAELHTLNGDYDASNDCYRQAYAIMPNFTYYRSMVTNMRLKGDPAAARALVEEYKQVITKEQPGQENEAARKDFIQFVETALQADLPGR